MSQRPIFFQEAEPTTRPVPKRRGRWLSRLLLLGFACLLLVAAAELGTRLLWGRSAYLFPRFEVEAAYGPYRLRTLEPSTSFRHTSADGSWLFTTNAQGFRDTQDYAYAKNPDVRRVLCLGDSQTVGFEARQDRIFPAIMERRLGRLRKAVEVLNTAVPGFGTAEQLAYLENEGIKYQPDVVVLAWSMDDLEENEKSGLYRVVEGALAPDKQQYAPGVQTLNRFNQIVPLRWASQHSYLYSVLFSRYWYVRRTWLSQSESTDARAAHLTYHGTQISSYGLELAAALVAKLHETCKARGAKLVIVDVPWLPNDNTGFASSLPPGLAQQFEQHCDDLIEANEVLGVYGGVTDIFVPHGEHHISETSHLLLGMALAAKVEPWVSQ